MITKDDLDQIVKYITDTGKKDSDFPRLDVLYGPEDFTLVKDGINYKISSDIIKYYLSNGDIITLGGIQVVDTVDDLKTIVAKGIGNIVYVKDIDSYYSWSASKEWHAFAKLYIGLDPPTDKNTIWVQTEDEVTPMTNESAEMAVLQQQVADLTSKVDQVMKVITNGVNPGDTTVSLKNDAMSGRTPVEPTLDENGKLVPGRKGEPIPVINEAEHTVKYICPKKDTEANFIANKNSLSEGELVFFTDKLQLGCYSNGEFQMAQLTKI